MRVSESDEEYITEKDLSKKSIITPNDDTKAVVRKSIPQKTIEHMKARLRLETKITSILQEVVVYFTFVAVVLVMVHGHNNVGTKFYTTNAVEDMLVRRQFGGNLTFDKVCRLITMWGIKFYRESDI